MNKDMPTKATMDSFQFCMRGSVREHVRVGGGAEGQSMVLFSAAVPSFGKVGSHQ